MIIDSRDKKLLDLLQRDSRMPYKEIAAEMRVSEGTVYNRIDKLRKHGVLKGFTVQLDPELLGYDLTALIGVRVEGAFLKEVEKEIGGIRSALCVYDITGDYDCIVVGRFRSRKELNDFVKKVLAMKHVVRTYTNMVLNVEKEGFSLPF